MDDAVSPTGGGSAPIQPWPVLETNPAGDFRIFRVRIDRKRSPRTGEPHNFYLLDCADWVNVVALTPDEQIVMIEQYRHGSNTVELEIPGGVIDPADPSPLAAGLRELREETGYEGTGAELIGEIFPNPAIMGNVCHTALVRNCRLLHPTDFDHGEDLATKLVPVQELPGLLRAGRIRHSLVMVALCHFEHWRARHSTS